MKPARAFEHLAWASWREALAALIGFTRLGDSSRLPEEQAVNPAGEIGEWLADAARRAGCEADPIAVPLGDLAGELAVAWPAVLRLPSNGGYLAVVGAGGKHLQVLTPTLARKRVRIAAVCSVLRTPHDAPLRAELEQLLEGKLHRAADILLSEQLAHMPFRDGWVLRPAAGAPARQLLRQAGIVHNGWAMVGLHAAQYALWLLSWALLGRLSLAGHLDRAWLFAWALLLLTLVPCQVLTTWLQGLFAIGLGAFLKRRLLAGALQLQPEEMRRGGIGTFLGQALEAEAVETLALSGGVAGLLALVELLFALLVLGRFSVVLLFWIAVTVMAAWRFLQQYERWTGTRLDLTEDLVESMVGHRTRLAQLAPGEWHAGEDRALTGYHADSRKLDNAGAWLIAAIPRGWLVSGLLCLLPSLSARGTAAGAGQTAVLIGGVLLAYTALRKLTGSFADAAAAVVACRRIGPLFTAAGRPEKLGDGAVSLPQQAAGARPLLEADGLTFRYRATGKFAVAAGCLSISAGDRILLEGPSGGGKTTFASLLAGLRTPESGLLLAHGLDRETIGDANWRKRIASAPQFHENHILTETLAFNLLLGRAWPPAPADLDEAETLCRELGLGNLLDSMPAGILQMVGEGGWQLSHGERSRIFIARALLQKADLVMLDESFAALDPDNARVALETTLDRAKTLLVIAHP